MHPPELRYTKDHEWVRLEDQGLAQVGITHYAQEQLGDVVFLSLPEVGSPIKQFEKFGEIESVKSVSDLFSPVSGQVVEVNTHLLDAPELVNEEPYGRGWLIRVALDDPSEADQLLSNEEYDALIGQAQ